MDERRSMIDLLVRAIETLDEQSQLAVIVYAIREGIGAAWQAIVADW